MEMENKEPDFYMFGNIRSELSEKIEEVKSAMQEYPQNKEFLKGFKLGLQYGKIVVENTMAFNMIKHEISTNMTSKGAAKGE